MRRIQTFGTLFLLIIILTATVFLPPAVSRIKDRMLFENVKTQLLDEKPSVAVASMNAAGKIALINNFRKNDKKIVLVSQDQQLGGALTEQDAPAIALSELENLKKRGIFPEIDLNNEFKCNYTLMTYTDMDHPGSNVQVWNFSFSNGKNIINLIMDADTHLIYQFDTWSNVDFLPAIDSEVIPQKFAEYLGIKWESKFDNQFGQEQYSAADGKILYRFSREDAVKGLKGLSILITGE